MKAVLRNSLIALGGVALIGGGFSAWVLHGNPTDLPIEQFEGKSPKLVDPQPETIPSIGLVKPVGWAAGEAPKPAAGLTVTRCAEGLNLPRTLLVLPNGDVLAAQTNASADGRGGGLSGFVMGLFFRIVGADVPSPDTIVLLRDSKGTGVADQRFELAHAGLHSPSGMAYGAGKLYIANDNAVQVWDYALGDTSLKGAPTKIMDLPGGGNHWMRNLLLSADGKKLYVAVGSATNIAENGMEAEKYRAGIWEINLATHHARQFAAGMRNPNGLGWNPSTGELWATVNERDQIGPNLVPDYLTNVPVGAHYGWPWVYWGKVVDERVDIQMPEYLTDYSRKPEYAMGPHVAALGLAFVTGGQKMGAGFANGAFVAEHGSWNRRPVSGYDVVFVKFDGHGNPQGLPVPVLTGFLADQSHAHGRPVWLGWAKDGALLVSDDTGGVVWRVIAPGATPAPTIKPVVTDHMKPREDLVDPTKMDPSAVMGQASQTGASFGKDEKVRQ